MPKRIVVNQTISKHWVLPEGKTPKEFLAEVLEYGFDEEPEIESVVSEEYFLMDENGQLGPLESEEA